MVTHHQLIVSPRVIAKLTLQKAYIADQAGPIVAERYIAGLFDYLENLATFPERGHPLPEIIPGLRMIGYGRSANIAVVVERPCVYVVGVYFGGEDYETALQHLDKKDT